MSLMQMIFKKPEEVFGEDGEEPVEKQPLDLLSVKGDRISTVLETENIELLLEKEQGRIRLVQKNSGGEELKTLMECPYAENADARKELTDMMTAVKKDIESAIEVGRTSLRIPESKYELFMYMRRRPSIPMDMDKLNRELSSGEARENVALFRSFLEKNPRINVYVGIYTLGQDTAYRILKQEWRMFSNVRFIVLENYEKKPISWSDPRIQESLKDSPNVASIGIGIKGDRPRYAIELRTEDLASSVKKAALLSHHLFNIREEMIDAQTQGFAKAMWELGAKRGKSEEFIRKTVEDLALEDACYRISETAAKEIVKKVQERGFNEGEDIGLFRVPVLDRRLLLNLLKKAENGFLVVDDAGQFQYYRDMTGKLVMQYGWEKDGCWYIAPKGKEEKEIRAEAAKVLLEGKYLQALGKILMENRNCSVSDAYSNLKNFIVSYEKLGMGEGEQIETLGLARDFFPKENIEEIQTVIGEVLSEGSLYDNFGF